MVWTAGAVLLVAPGLVIGRLLRIHHRDVGVSASLVVAAGMSFWPALMLFTTLAGLRWTATSARAFATLIVIAAICSAAPRRRLRRLNAPWLIALSTLAIATIWTRWMHIRDLAFPPWVDGVHHAMIVRLIVDHGAVPRSFSPFIEGGDFYYHWGFHALAAWTAWITGTQRAIDMPRLLLDFGQLLNAFALLMVYAAARVLLRSRWAALVAAGIAMLVSYFPAYYLSWGRYTHLAGILLIPPLFVALWQLGCKLDWRSMALAVLIASGLVLIHVRMAFFAAVFAIELVVLLLWQRRWKSVIAWALAAVLTFIVVAPWLVRVARDRYAHAFIAAAPAPVEDVHQIIPVDILWSPHNRELLAIATCGITGMAGWLGMPIAGRVLSAGWWIACIFLARRRSAATIDPWRPIALLLVFCGVIALLLGWHGWGVDFTRFASVSSAIMSIFLPLSIAAAVILMWAGQRVFGVQRTATIALSLVAITIATGIVTLRDIVNPQTVFADENDFRALEWIDSHVEPAARFVVSAHPWMGSSWVGSDGGYWIGVATNSRSTLPPLLYAWALPDERVQQIDNFLLDSNRADALRQPAILGELRIAGVTHVYCGSRGNPTRLRDLLGSGHVKVVHREGNATVAQIVW